MNSKYALALAVVLGVIAAFAVQDYLRKEHEKLEAKVRPVKVVFSRNDIASGEQLRDEVLESRDWPQAYVTDQLVLWEERDQKLVGKVASQRISAGKPVFLDDVSVKKAPSPALALPPGMRAYTLPTDLITGVAGMIRPGAHVDVVAHFKDLGSASGGRGRAPSSSGQVATTVTLLENVTVLSVGAFGGRHWGGRGREEADTTSATLVVTPVQAAVLLYAQKEGSVTLLLRQEGDGAKAGPPMVDENNFLQRVQEAQGAGR